MSRISEFRTLEQLKDYMDELIRDYDSSEKAKEEEQETREKLDIEVFIEHGKRLFRDEILHPYLSIHKIARATEVIYYKLEIPGYATVIVKANYRRDYQDNIVSVNFDIPNEKRYTVVKWMAVHSDDGWEVTLIDTGVLYINLLDAILFAARVGDTKEKAQQQADELNAKEAEERKKSTKIRDDSDTWHILDDRGFWWTWDGQNILSRDRFGDVLPMNINMSPVNSLEEFIVFLRGNGYISSEIRQIEDGGFQVTWLR